VAHFGVVQAFLVEPFVASKVVPGLKTRRLDRLSIWALVASSLALQDARIEPGNEILTKAAVVFGTGFGPLDLTAAFCASASEYGCAKADAIVFPRRWIIPQPVTSPKIPDRRGRISPSPAEGFQARLP